MHETLHKTARTRWRCSSEELEREKNAMKRIWKSREKQIEKVRDNAIEMFGSIKGIAGNAIGEIKTLELGFDAGYFDSP